MPRVVVVGHALSRTFGGGITDELATEEPTNRRVAAAFDELAMAI